MVEIISNSENQYLIDNARLTALERLLDLSCFDFESARTAPSVMYTKGSVHAWNVKDGEYVMVLFLLYRKLKINFYRRPYCFEAKNYSVDFETVFNTSSKEVQDQFLYVLDVLTADLIGKVEAT